MGAMGLLKDTVKDFSDDECSVRAAALAYYTIFALPPLLILLLMVAGLIWDPADVQRALESQFAGLLGADGAQQIHEMIVQADRPDTGGPFTTLVSLGGLLFGATGVFMQLQGALNRAWEVTPDPEQGGVKSFLGKRLLSVGMVLGLGFLIAVLLALTAGVSAVGGALGASLPEPLLHVLNFGLSFVVLALLFAAMFKILPDAEVAWRDVGVGALATAGLFVIGKFAIGFYLGQSEPGSAFGAAGALAIVLVWTYYAAMIMLLGAEFTQQWARRRGADIVPEQGAVRVVERKEHVREEAGAGAPSGAPAPAPGRPATGVPVPAFAAAGAPASGERRARDRRTGGRRASDRTGRGGLGAALLGVPLLYLLSGRKVRDAHGGGRSRAV
jgi:membrane protein